MFFDYTGIDAEEYQRRMNFSCETSVNNFVFDFISQNRKVRPVLFRSIRILLVRGTHARLAPTQSRANFVLSQQGFGHMADVGFSFCDRSGAKGIGQVR